MDVWLKKPAKKSSNKKLIGLNKNCKATTSCKKQKKCEYKDSRSQSKVTYICSDKNCQEIIHMWSVTKESDVWSLKPAVPYEYRARTRTVSLQDATRKEIMTITVNLCKNLNLKELYYNCHMETVPELFNTRSNCQWIVHSLK